MASFRENGESVAGVSWSLGYYGGSECSDRGCAGDNGTLANRYCFCDAVRAALNETPL